MDIKVAVPAFESFDEEMIWKELEKAGLPVSGKAQLYDGTTGEAYKEKSVVGVNYILKLSHMVEDKTHARFYRTLLFGYSAASWR